MTQNIHVRLVDDLDGSAGEDVSTVYFGLDGRYYEIDLGKANRARLVGVLVDFVAAARRTGITSAADRRNKHHVRAIRVWASANGYDLPDRGRLPTKVIEAFEISQGRSR